jgi:hypothetical protein
MRIVSYGRLIVERTQQPQTACCPGARDQPAPVRQSARLRRLTVHMLASADAVLAVPQS